MNRNHIRKIAAPIAGVIAAVVLWFWLTSIISKAGSMSLSGLIPTLISGLVGGLVVSLVAPNKKIFVATITGLALSAVLLSIIILSGRFPLLNRNPLFWYWPIWFIPAYYIGGLIGSRAVKSV